MRVYLLSCTAGDVGRHDSAHDTLPVEPGLQHASS